MKNEQTYENHIRWNPLFHFVLVPLLFILLIFAIVRMVQDPGIDRAADIIVAIALVLINLSYRLHSLRVQDRVIRLEERLRFQKLLPAELAKKAVGLRTSELIALRFASDEELEDLVSRVVAGEFEKPAEIKRAIKNWRGDYLRA